MLFWLQNNQERIAIFMESMLTHEFIFRRKQNWNENNETKQHLRQLDYTTLIEKNMELHEQHANSLRAQHAFQEKLHTSFCQFEHGHSENCTKIREILDEVKEEINVKKWKKDMENTLAQRNGDTPRLEVQMANMASRMTAFENLCSKQNQKTLIQLHELEMIELKRYIGAEMQLLKDEQTKVSCQLAESMKTTTETLKENRRKQRDRTRKSLNSIIDEVQGQAKISLKETKTIKAATVLAERKLSKTLDEHIDGNIIEKLQKVERKQDAIENKLNNLDLQNSQELQNINDLSQKMDTIQRNSNLMMNQRVQRPQPLLLSLTVYHQAIMIQCIIDTIMIRRIIYYKLIEQIKLGKIQ